MNYGPFIGDGRVKMLPTFTLPGTAPATLTRAAARSLIDRFVELGRSNHSAMGGTLWVIMTWLHYTGRNYTLEACPGFGYQIVHTDERPVP